MVALARPKSPGVYAIRARHVEAKAGEQGGKKYKEVRYYSTLTFPVRAPAGGVHGVHRLGRVGRGPGGGQPEVGPHIG